MNNLLIQLILLALIFILLLIKNKKISFLLIGIILTLFYTYRIIPSIDDRGYELAFNYYKQGIDISYMEFTFRLIVKLSLLFTDSIKMVYFIYSSLSFLFVLLTINNLYKRKIDVYIFFTYFILFLLLPTLTIMRQFLALSLVSFAFSLLLSNKKMLLPIVLVILSFFIHKTAIFILPFLLLVKIKVNPIIFVAVIPLAFFLGEAAYANIIIEFIAGRGFYESYMNNYELDLYKVGGLITIIIVFSIINLFLQSLTVKKNNVDFKQTNLWIFYLTLFLLLTNSGWASRISFYFTLFVPLIFVQIKDMIKRNVRRRL